MSHIKSDNSRYKETFERLFDEFCKHFEKQNVFLRSLKNGELKIRSSAFSEVHKAMINHAGVLAFMENDGMKIELVDFGWWFYKTVNNLKKLAPGKRIKVRDPWYEHCYAIFLGYKDLDDFEQKLDLGKSPDPSALAPAPAAASPYIQHYIGVYYSIKSYWIKKFLLSIDFTPRPDGIFPATQWGFHVQHEDDDLHSGKVFTIPEKVNSIQFEGSARQLGKHLYINLAFNGNELIKTPIQMNLIGVVDDWGAPDKKIIVSSLQTASLKGYVVTLEAVLLQTTPDIAHLLKNHPLKFFSPVIPGVEQDEQDCLRLYLMLQRRNFWASDKIVQKLTDLQVRSTRVEPYTVQLRGKWRIWNFGIGEPGRVVQSLLEIESPLFASFLHPYIQEGNPKATMLRKQVAALTISEGKLYINTYSVGKGSHLRMANNAIFDFRKLTNYGQGYAEGVYISGAESGHHSLIGGYCVMCKISKFEKDRDEPRILKREEAENLASQLGISEMYEALHLLWKKKHDRKHTRTAHYGVRYDPERGYLLIKRTRGMFKGRYEFPGGKVEFGKSPTNWLEEKFLAQTNLVATFEPMKYVSSIEFPLIYAGEEVRYHSVGILYEARVSNEPRTTSDIVVWKKKEDIRPNELTPLTEKIMEDLKNYTFFLKPPPSTDMQQQEPLVDDVYE